MAVYLCHPCGVTIIEIHKVAKPVCPRCGKDVVPKAGPGSIEEAFPEKAPHDSVFELDLNNLPPSIDPVKRGDQPK
jgi:DNA-directed RNA polymerase subunit RPC12/RpoP